MENLKVLVLDDNPVSILTISRMLANYSFKATPFQRAEEALNFLKTGSSDLEQKLDLMLAEVHLSNAAGTLSNSQLFHYVDTELKVPIITMCAYDDELAASECVATGACFHLQKPLTTGSCSILKQKALLCRSKRAAPEVPRNPEKAKGNENSSSHDKCKSNSGDEEDDESDVKGSKVSSKKSTRLVWTTDLHDKFLNSLQILGRDAVPRNIIRMMNVNGLTIKQVASHLQKHRMRVQKANQPPQMASMRPLTEQVLSSYDMAASASVGLSTTPALMFPITPLIDNSTAKAEASNTSTSTETELSVWDKYLGRLLSEGLAKSSKDKMHSMSPFFDADCAQIESGSSNQPATENDEIFGAETANAEASNVLPGDQMPFSAAPENAFLESSESYDWLVSLLEELDADAACHRSSSSNNNNNGVHLENAGPSADASESDPWGELKAFWMDQLEGSEQQNFGSNDFLQQVNDAWDDVLASVSPANVDVPMAQDLPEQIGLLPSVDVTTAAQRPIGDDSVSNHLQQSEHDHLQQSAEGGDAFWDSEILSDMLL